MYAIYGFSCIATITFIWILISAIVTHIRNRWTERVRMTSNRLEDMGKINSGYAFHPLKEAYISYISHQYKTQFDHFNYIKNLNIYIEKNIDLLEQIIAQAQDNRKLLIKYQVDMHHAAPVADRDIAQKAHVPYGFYTRTEEQLIQEITQIPVTEPSIICRHGYSSPQGRNSYYDERQYSFEEWVQKYAEIKEQIMRKSSEEYIRKKERRKLTPSLRYDVMKRDEFKCVLCGRHASDSVQLHVDHIVPIAKGGKTTFDNLRTLCQDCNLGKRDKYDAKGEN